MRSLRTAVWLPIVLTVLVLISAHPSYAVTPPAFQISDSAGNVVTIDTSGSVTFSGSCTSTTCGTSLIGFPLPGQITWGGTLGTFTVSATVGTTKPATDPANPEMDISLQHLTASTSGTGGTLTVKWTDTGFTPAGVLTSGISAGGIFSGNATVLFQGYVDNSNLPFGTGVLLGTLGPFQSTGSTSTSYGANGTGGGPSQSPFSMTEVLTLVMGPGALVSGDFDLYITPKCAGAIGDFVWVDLNGNGIQDAGEVGINGVTVQLKDSGNNPISTMLTGDAPGTYTFTPPGANGAGYYQFFVCGGSYNVVVDSNQPALSGYIPSPNFQGGNPASDSNGSPAAVTLPTDTSIDETIDFGFFTPAALTVQCAASTGQVGVAYNSSFQVTGGATPFTFTIVNGTLPPGLTLNATTGALTGTPTTAGTFNFTVQVKDSSGLAAGTVTKNCGITINPPDMTAQCVSATTGKVGVFYSSPIAVTGGASPYTFAIASGSLPPGLTLDANTGVISGTPTTTGSFSFTVTVTDSTPGQHATATTSNCGITINPPDMTAQCVSVTTGKVGTPYSSFITVSGGTAPYTFALASGSIPTGLTLNTSTGEISGTPTVAGPFSFTVKVTDSTGGVQAVATTSNCGITIAPPDMTALCVSATTGKVGTPYSSFITVSGGTAPYTFALASGSLPTGLTLNASTGAISGTPTVAGPFSFTVKVTDSTGGVQAVATTSNCGITIAPPDMTALCVSATTGKVGTPYSSSITVTGGNSPYTFTLNSGSLPTGLTLNASTGVISGTPTVAGPFSFTVKVTDSTGGVQAVATTSNCGITIAPTDMTALCVSATTGKVGTPYSSSITVTGGNSPYTFTLNSGSLPTGLTLNASTGVISGTPTVAGPFSFTVKVTDSTGGVQAVATTSNCGITIAPPDMTALCVSATTGKVGTPYSSFITVSGGTAPYTFALASGSLPTGLTLNASTGAISGTPTVAGPFSFTVKVTDSTGGVHAVATTSNCGITIAPPDMTALCVSATNGTVGVPYNSSITVTGGTAPYTFALNSGSLPTGLTLNASTGAISGTPTVAGSFSFSIKVTDSTAGVKAIATTNNCGITINQPGTIIVKKVTNPSTDTTTNFTFTTSGAGYNGFSLRNGGTNTQVVLPGSYSVTESALSGWTLIGLSCTATSGSNATVNGSNATISLASGGTVTCTYTNGQTGSFCSFTPGGWGAPPNGGNIATALYYYFPSLYPKGVMLGGTSSPNYAITLTSASAVTTYLPDGGTPYALTQSYKNPVTTNSGEFGTQVAALQFNVDFSAKGYVKPGFNTKKVISGPLAGLTMTQVLSLAEAALSGNTGVLTQYGITVAQLTTLLGNYNGNYDNCSSNTGFLQ